MVRVCSRAALALAASALICSALPASAETAEVLRAAMARSQVETRYPDLDALTPKALALIAALPHRPAWCAVPTKLDWGTFDSLLADPSAQAPLVSGAITNVWRVYARSAACGGNATPIRFTILQPGKGEHRLTLAGFGETYVWPTLYRDASKNVALSVAVARTKANLPQCDAGEGIERSRIASSSPNLGPPRLGVRLTGDWTEVWTVHSCGMGFDVPVTFHADGTGGAIFQIGADNVARLR